MNRGLPCCDTELVKLASKTCSSAGSATSNSWYSLSVIWKTGFPYHRPQVSCGNMARQPDWRQAVDHKAHQHRGSPGTALSRTKVRSAGSFGHSPSGCTLQEIIRALSEEGRVAHPEGTR